jgi:hypothetical protein
MLLFEISLLLLSVMPSPPLPPTAPVAPVPVRAIAPLPVVIVALLMLTPPLLAVKETLPPLVVMLALTLI